MKITSFITSSLLILSFSLFAQTEKEIIESQIAVAQQITQKWMEKKKEGLSYRDLYEGQPERAQNLFTGIPSFVKVINSKNVMFRHYIGSNMPIILKTSQLKTGITPYVVINPGYSRDIYQDLTGMFLTTPQTPPEKIGLLRNPNADYIDFTLYDGTPVVQIENEIFLIPGRQDLPEWVKELYRDYKRTGRADTRYVETFNRIDAQGGVEPTFMKVKIKSYRMNGKVVNL